MPKSTTMRADKRDMEQGHRLYVREEEEMEKGYWAIVTWESGSIGEKMKYWTPGEPPTRSERKRKSDLRKQRANAANAYRHLNRLMNVNFPSSCGYTIALTYDDEHLHRLTEQEYREGAPEQFDEIFLSADHQLELFLRRVRRQCKQAGIEFRYIALTSDLRFDGRLQTYVHTRVHHHIVVNPESLDLCLKAWHFGQARETRLKAEPDHYDFAEYLLKQVRQVKAGAARYIPSRNLRKPKESVPRIAPSGREVQPPRGAVLLYRAPYEYGRPQYIRYIIPRKTEDKTE